MIEIEEPKNENDIEAPAWFVSMKLACEYLWDEGYV